MNSDPKLQQAHKSAVEALKNSYAPYSKFHVACILSTVSGEFVGVNVENASYGATICAERSAIVSAISQKGQGNAFEFMVLVSDSKKGVIPPCGMCLQVIKEFVDDDFPIYLGTLTELKNKMTLKDFLPISFGSEMLDN